MRRRPCHGVLLICGVMWATAGLTASDTDRAALSTYLDRALSEDDGFEDRFEAEVWLVDMQQRLTPLLPDAQERLTLLTQVHQQATRLNLSPELVLSLIEVESGFDREAQHLSRALAAYNGSSGSNRYPDKVRAAWHARWRNGPLDW